MWQEEKTALIRSGWVITAIGLFLTFVTSFPQEKGGSVADVLLTLVTGLGLSLFLTVLCLPIVYRRKFSQSDLMALVAAGAAVLLVGEMNVVVPWQGIVAGIFILIFMASFLFSGPRFK